MANFTNIETSYVNRYSADVLHALQQKTTRLRNFVTNKPDCSGVAEFIDKIGQASALDKTARFADSPVQEITHKRRRVSAQPKHAGYFVEGFDSRRMNYDVFQPYAEATSMAMARKMDEVIRDAAFGSAYESDGGAMDGATEIVWNSSNFPNQFIDKTFFYGSSANAETSGVISSTASTGYTLSIDKLLKARRILSENEADQYDEGGNPLYFIVCSAAQIEALLHSTRVQSSDYNNIRALVEGQTNFFAGFQFIRYESMPTTGTGVTQVEKVLAFHPRGLAFCSWMEPITEIERRGDKSFVPYAYFEMDVGATRVWEEMVIQIDCYKT
jgi:hypothetical protein